MNDASPPEDADPFGDVEQRKFIDSFPITTLHSIVAGQCRERFGAAWAWPRQKIMRYRLARRRRGGQLSFADRDPELAAFVEDRIGCGSIDWIRSEAIRVFGAKRTPSRSAIHGFETRVRSRDAAQFLVPRLDADPDLRALVEAAFNIVERYGSIVQRRRRRRASTKGASNAR